MVQDGADYADEWRVTDDDPRSWVRGMGCGIAVFGLPGLALLVAGGADALLLAAGCVLVGVLIGALDGWRGRRDVVAIRLEPPADPVQFTVRRVDGSVATYPIAAVDRVHVRRYDDDLPSLSMRIRTGGRKIRTRSGMAHTAEDLLAAFAAAGATVTTKDITSD